jgi:hypothetical protein
MSAAFLHSTNAKMNDEHRDLVWLTLETARKNKKYEECEKALGNFWKGCQKCVADYRKYSPGYATGTVQYLADIIDLSLIIGVSNMLNWPSDRLDIHIDDPLYTLITNVWMVIYYLAMYHTGDHAELDHILPTIDAVYNEMSVLAQKEDDQWTEIFVCLPVLSSSIATQN